MNTKTEDPKQSLNRAIFEMGGTAAAAAEKLSELTGKKITKYAVGRWRTDGVPAWAVHHVEALSGVPWQQLRPDMVPDINQDEA